MPADPKRTLRAFLLLALAWPATAGAAPPPLKEPNNAPPLLLKDLEVVKLDKESMLLTYTSDDVLNAPKPGDRFKFRHETVQNGRRVILNSPFIPIGENVFGQGPCKDRFFFFGIAQKQVKNPRNGLPQVGRFATIEDRKPNKKGLRYEIQKGSRNGLIIRDYTATLRLNTPGQAQKLLEVEEGGTFTLPFGRQNPDRRYTFSNVDKNGDVVIEYLAGAKSRQAVLKAPPE